MTKSLKQRAARFIFTTARLAMVRRGLDDEQTYGEIAERLGTTRQMVREAVEREGWVAAMSTGYQVVVSDKDAPKSREWVETARDSAAAKALCDYLNPRLPDGKEASSRWEAFDPAMPRFDLGKMTEQPNEPPKEGA